jgi:hypothetical protein
MGVPELAKPTARWCADCEQGTGCRVYDTRPPSCRNFQCFWLMSEDFPEEMRPDRCHALVSFNDTPDSVVLHVDPAYPRTLQSRPVRQMIDALLKVYERVFVLNGKDSAMMKR